MNDSGNFFLFIGQLPTWLQGILLRNGPGMHTIGESKYNHWFDGMALLHSFTFKNGKLLHSGLKGAQQPTFWCLTLLIVFWVGLEWVLSAEGCVRGICCGGSLSSQPPHLTLHSTAGTSLQGCLQGDVKLSFLLQCPSSVLLSRQDSTNPALGRSLRGSLLLPPGARKALLFAYSFSTRTGVPRGCSAVDAQASFREDQHSPFGIRLQL